MVVTSDTPWSEKYRPQTLDEVAFHNDIIDTSRPAGQMTDCVCSWAGVEVTCSGLPTRQRVTPGSPISPIGAVKKLLNENQLPHLLLYGPPGTGKTSTILALARQMYGPGAGNMVLELNASDDRGIGIVRNEIQDFAGTRSIFK